MNNLNWIQNEILHRLADAESLTYSELMPENIDQGQYNYHLKHLISKGYVKKSDSEYKISQQGIVEFARTDGKGSQLLTAKPIILLAMENSDGKFLMIKNPRKPNKDVLVFPTQVLSWAIPASVTIRTMVVERFKVDIKNIEYCGVLRRVYQLADSNYDERLFLVHSAQIKGTLSGKSEPSQFVDFRAPINQPLSKNAPIIVEKLVNPKSRDYLEIIDDNIDPQF